jgi:hypothetical protein
MAKSPHVGQVEYLVFRRFPAAKAIFPSISQSSSWRGGISNKRRKELLDEIKRYVIELKSKTPTELQELFDAERAKQAAEEQGREEQARFFNQLYANADFEHWSKAAHWTLDEAIALSFGKAPEIVSWEKIKSLVTTSPFAHQYHRRRDLALRAVTWKQLFDPVLPGIFLAWAKRTDLSVPPELEGAVTARGVQVADWKTLHDEAKKSFDDLKRLYDDLNTKFNENHREWMKMGGEKNEAIERLLVRVDELQRTTARDERGDLKTRERESLLRLVIGMAIIGYGYDPKVFRSGKISEIAGDLELAGVPLDADTVRKWLRAAAEVLPPTE